MKKEYKNWTIGLFGALVLFTCVYTINQKKSFDVSTIEINPIILEHPKNQKNNNKKIIENLLLNSLANQKIEAEIIDIHYDDSKLGDFKNGEALLKIKGKKHSISFDYSVKDTMPPSIESKVQYKTKLSEKLSFKDVKAKDLVDGKLEPVFIGEINWNKAGEYPLIIKSEDSSKNQTEKKIVVIVEESKTVAKKEELKEEKTNNSEHKVSKKDNNDSKQNKEKAPSQVPSKPKTEQKSQTKPQSKPKPESKPSENKATSDTIKPSYLDQMAREMHVLVNEERQKNGLETLEWDERLVKSARVRVKEITQNFSHTRPNGESFEFLDPGYLDNENIAFGAISAEDVHYNVFLLSPPHTRTILNPEYKKAGYAVYRQKDGRRFFVQTFSNGIQEEPPVYLD